MDNERGYFRSPGRGVKNGKIEFPFLSIGRTPMRRCASESSMSQLYQVIFSIQKDGYRLVYSNLKLKSYLKIGLFRPLKSPSSVYHFRKINKISFFINKSSRRVIWSFWFYRNVPVSPRIISGILNTCWKCLEHIFRINFKSNIFSKILFFQTKIGQTRVTKKDFQKNITFEIDSENLF